MRIARLLRLSTPSCIECGSPLVKASVVVVEREGKRKLVSKVIGIACLSCGTQYDALMPLHAVRHIAPFEWNAPDLQPQGNVDATRSAGAPSVCSETRVREKS